MTGFIDAFTNSPFFNPPDDRVYQIPVTVFNDKGTAKKNYGEPIRILDKVIRPISAYKKEKLTIDADAILNVPTRLQFYTSENTSDIIKWQDKYYKIVNEYNRQDSNGYSYRYMLKYLNKDAEINEKL